MNSLDELRFNLTITLRFQDSVAETVSRFCNRTIEKPFQVVGAGVMKFRSQEKNNSCNSDPNPSWQGDFLADPFANVINAMVQEQNWQTKKEAKKGHATQRNAYFHDVRFSHCLTDEKAKHTVDEIEQPPQLLWRGIIGP